MFTQVDIPAGTYPNQDDIIRTVMQPNFLAVRADVSEDTVYAMINAIFENLEVLWAASSAAESVTLDIALNGLSMPLHPGAARYYREEGIEIPEILVE